MTRFLSRLTLFALDRPKLIIGVMVAITFGFALQFPKIHIDTDPENMLEPDQPDRRLYDQVKEEFGIHDFIVAGIVDKKGIFRPEALKAIASAISQILKIDGVIPEDMISLTTTDNITPEGGLLNIHPVMEGVPKSRKELARLRQEIAKNPFLHEKIASADGKAVALYVPIEKKSMSFVIAQKIKKILNKELIPSQRYCLAGLPIAEDTFGHEMFIQMAIVAPLAFLGILLLVFALFRQWAFLLPIGIDAMFAVVWAMGLLIGTGQVVHIMSSMIPVFLMPIAILDDVHILSEFFDQYRKLGDKRKALIAAMQPLYRPMLYTSLTSGVGFASLSLTAIPPVRVFGLFVAFGIMAAWLFSMTIVPAVISLMNEQKMKAAISQEKAPHFGERLLQSIHQVTYYRAKGTLLIVVALLFLSIAGIFRIVVNDNPVRWFKAKHPVRVADREMNAYFAGTYMAYLVAEASDTIKRPEVVCYIEALQAYLEKDPLVGKTSSITDIIKRINSVLHDEKKSYYRLPNSSGAIGQYLFLFQMSGDPNDLDNFLNRDNRKANIWIQMKGGNNRQMGKVVKEVRAFLKKNPPSQGPRFRWSGLTYINKVWQELMVVGMLKAVLGSFVVVLILMIVELGSLSLGFLSMVPLILSILFSYGVVGLIGKEYDMPSPSALRSPSA